MFVFQFQTRLQWYSSRVHEETASILWKITISGPFVTLYSDMEYVSIGIHQRYSLVVPESVEHIHAHEENIFGGFYRSDLRDTHTHVTLPCQQDIVMELRALLKLIETNNKPNKKLINSASIDRCIEAYRRHLNTAFLDEHKDNAAHLILKWMAPYTNEGLFDFDNHDTNITQNSPKNSLSVNIDSVCLAINQYLDYPSQDTFELLRKEVNNIFKKLEKYPQLQNEIITKIKMIIPLSSTVLFSAFVKKRPLLILSILLIYMRLYADMFCSLLINHIIKPKSGEAFLLVFGLIYSLSLLWNIHKLIPSSVYTNLEFVPSLTEMFNRRTKILMFSDAPNESDKTEMKIEKQLS